MKRICVGGMHATGHMCICMCLLCVRHGDAGELLHASVERKYPGIPQRVGPLRTCAVVAAGFPLICRLQTHLGPAG